MRVVQDDSVREDGEGRVDGGERKDGVGGAGEGGARHTPESDEGHQYRR